MDDHMDSHGAPVGHRSMHESSRVKTEAAADAHISGKIVTQIAIGISDTEYQGLISGHDPSVTHFASGHVMQCEVAPHCTLHSEEEKKRLHW